MAVVQVINSLSSKSERVMILVRAFALHCLCVNLLFLASHMLGMANGIADVLSHKQMERLCQLPPDTDLELVRILENLWSTGG